MIRVTCPGCGSTIGAKDELLGETRKCPKCGKPLLISPRASANVPASDGLGITPPKTDSTADDAGLGAVKKVEAIERLNRLNYYLILNKSSIVCAWENDGRGWMLRTSAGMIPASRNLDQLPGQGNFQMVELKLSVSDKGKRLEGLQVYQLAQRYALTAIEKGDDNICKRITGHCGLNKDQKHQVRKLIREQFMQHVWEDATNVFEFLGNVDQHTSQVG